jgi:hypothetical protein
MESGDCACAFQLKAGVDTPYGLKTMARVGRLQPTRRPSGRIGVSLQGLAAREDALEQVVQWLGASEVPESIASGLQSRGVKLLGLVADPRPPARIAVVNGLPKPTRMKSELTGRRLLVLHSDPEQAHLLGLVLSARGAACRVISAEGAIAEEIACFDPDAVLLDEHELFGGSWAGVCALWAHMRLRWTPILLLPWTLLEPSNLAGLEALYASVHALCEGYDVLVRRAAERRVFEHSLSSLGPARTLRALLQAGCALRVQVATQRLRVDVDLMDHLVLGARGGFADGASIELSGARALACLFGEDVGTVLVGPGDPNPLTNIRAPLESALQRGPDGAWLSAAESELCVPQHVDSSLDHDDETLIGTLTGTPNSSGVRMIAEAQRGGPDLLSEEPGILGHTGPTRKVPAGELLAALEGESSADSSAVTELGLGALRALPAEKFGAVDRADETDSSAEAKQGEQSRDESSRIQALFLPIADADGFPLDTAGVDTRAQTNKRRASRMFAALVLVLSALGLVSRARDELLVGSARGEGPSSPAPAPTAPQADTAVTPEREAPAAEPIDSVSADEGVDTPQQAVASTAAPSAAARRAVARLVRRANSQRKKGRLSRAHDNFVEALQLIPDDRGALFGLTRLALEERDASTALACAQKLVALDTDDDDYRALLARAEKMAGVP